MRFVMAIHKHPTSGQVFPRAVKILTFCLLLAPLHAQTDSGLVLHSDTRLVEIDVTVRDSAGKPVENLPQSDFTILDNGKPRPFTIFSANPNGANAFAESGPELTGQPAEGQAVRPSLPPGVFTNTSKSPAVPAEQHSTIILIDGINGWFENFVRGAKGIQGLMNKLPRGERIALYATTNFDGLRQLVDYTTDHELVRKTIANYIPSGMDPAPLDFGSTSLDGLNENERPAELGIDYRTPREVQYDIQRASEMTRSTFDAFARQLRSMPGRKSIYWLTQGLPARMIDGSGTTDKTISALIPTNAIWDKTIHALNDANVAVNAVDENEIFGWGRKWGGGGLTGMRLLAQGTGGQTIFHRDDLDAAIAESIANSRTDYTLGFYLGDLDGEYHK